VKWLTGQKAKISRDETFEEQIDCRVWERKDKRRGEVVIENPSISSFVYFTKFWVLTSSVFFSTLENLGLMQN
jgi:hypothetical protein